MMTSHIRQKGFTLLEVMVTLVILAIGLLGLAGLQITALQSNATAYERSQAVILAYDIIDRMRANRDNIASYVTVLGVQPTSTTCYGSGISCTPAELAAYDLNQWKCGLGKWNSDADCLKLVADGALTSTTGKLSNGDGSIAIDANNIVTVTIRWEENRDQTTAAAKLTTISVRTLI